MAYLMEISFDNSCRLARKRYIFQYRGVTFKLVQDTPRKWADHLLTIVPDHRSQEAEAAFAAACEFVSALGWEHRSRVAVWETGGGTWPAGHPLRLAEPRMRCFPRIPFGGDIVGYDLRRLPHVRTDEQRVALALYREAGAANSSYLQFLFYWQVMEVGRGADPVNFVNSAWRRDQARLHIQQAEIDALPIGARRLGNYLLDDCRDAIAHIRRRPGRTKLDLDVRDERHRLTRSAWVVKAFAEHYIRSRLGLTEHVWFMRPRRGRIPRFVDRETLRAGAREFERAYPEPRLRLFGRPAKGKR